LQGIDNTAAGYLQQNPHELFSGLGVIWRSGVEYSMCLHVFLCDFFVLRQPLLMIRCSKNT